MNNTLYYGDNLDVLRRHIGDESVDLIYLDPPFKSNQDYNVLFAERDGTQAAAQIKAFGDTWVWNEAAARTWQNVVEAGDEVVSSALRAFRTFLGSSDMLAYLSMMAPRLMELRRVLKRSGSIYLHCDPTASHYLKMLMDAVYGPSCFRNEIVWHYYNKFQRGDIPMFARDHDVILFYSRVAGGHHHFDSIYEERDEPIQQLMRKWDPATKRIVNAKGEDGHVMYRTVTHRKIDDVWRLPYIVPASREGLGYPTQKPESLLDRIIQASSRPGDVVLDPFCGCGTAIAVAQQLGRQWIGIDITHLAINLIRHRLTSAHGPAIEDTYQVIGEPVSVDGAEKLAADDPYQFQFWALGLVGARPQEEKKGADKGIDGRLYFHDEGAKGKTKQIIISVKAGKLQRSHVHELRGVVEREDAQIGALISFNAPTRQMREEAASAGFYTSPWGKHPRLQLLTVADLLDGRRIDYPATTGANVTYQRAPKQVKKVAEQRSLYDVDG